jgi:hypothetical protein
MNKLRDSFYKEVKFMERAEKCEQITDDFSIKFIEWSFWLNKRFETNQLTFKLDGVSYTSTELQQYFKENVYGK